MKQIKRELAEKIEDLLSLDVELNDIEIPEKQEAEFAYPAMRAASELNANPHEIANNLAEDMEDLEIIESIEVAGPGYVNFNLVKSKYAEIGKNTLEKERMGLKERNGKVLVEFSSPNLAKPMHVGHLRNNCLGDFLQRILRFIGFDVTSENYIGDWGTKHGQVIYAFKLWGSKEELEENPMNHMYELYVKLHEEADEKTKQKAREWSRRIEEGDEEAVKLWEKFREATIEYNEPIYDRMMINFDRVTGESEVAEQGEEIVEEGLEKGIFEEDEDGSIYVDFEDESLSNTVVRRDDGATLYITRDIANIIKREEEGFDLNLYVVATEQNLHFKQLFNLAEKFGVDSMESEHVAHGMLHLENGSMSSSKGNIIKLTDVISLGIELCLLKAILDLIFNIQTLERNQSLKRLKKPEN
ncbi:MAG: arginine--tRNA ligase [Nanohaloarchaea archaeon SW_10_44_10]|nr:MAG: arginine--tRNA ligase [Nanohaloarchaea archaeon SW_10_44_10]